MTNFIITKSISPAWIVACLSLGLALALPTTTHAIVAIPFAAPVTFGAISTLAFIFLAPGILAGLASHILSAGVKELALNVSKIVFYHALLLLVALTSTSTFNAILTLSFAAGLGLVTPAVSYVFSRIFNPLQFPPTPAAAVRLAGWNLFFTTLIIIFVN